ncbi:MAG: hypothetical protein ACTSPB_00010 [Candidatus Thorarchaeota archaeon]
MKMEGFVVLLENREIHCFEKREDYLAFVKDREDIAWLFATPKVLYDSFMEKVECVDALDWLDGIEGEIREGIIAEMEYRNDSKDVLLSAYRERKKDGE